MACAVCSSGIIEALILGGSCLDALDCTGLTPLQVALQHGHEHVVQAAMQALDKQRRFLQERELCQPGVMGTPLHRAAACNQPGVLRTLLESSSSDAAAHATGATPLVLAAQLGHEACMRELLAAAADLNAADRQGCSATFHAAAGGHWHCLRALLAAGADCNLACSAGWSPLHAAAQKGEEQLAALSTLQPMPMPCHILLTTCLPVFDLMQGTRPA